MQKMRLLLKIILGMGVISFGLAAYSLMGTGQKNLYIPEFIKERELSDNQVKQFAGKQAIKPEMGQLVLCHQASNSWSFGTITKQWPDDYFDITLTENNTELKHVSVSSIKTLAPLWYQLFQPTITLDKMRLLLDERAEYYHTHGTPDGHGLIFSPGSKIILLGDLHGNYPSLQNHMTELYKEGLIDEQLHLKPNCYLVALGDYTGDGGQGVPVLVTMLALQANNPDRVFLLRGDHEDIAKAKTDGFQKEWYETFCKSKADFGLTELVWLKLCMVWKSLPKLLLVGLAMPSTQHYEFLMFCHETFDYSWRPDSFLSRLIEKHINQYYKTPCVLEYRDSQSSDRSFGTGIITAQSTFQEFVERYGSRIDKKHMYQYCLCALIRGHECIQGGLVTFKTKGAKIWKALKDNKIYEIQSGSIYTCTSGSCCMSKAGCFDGAFGLIEAGSNGHWFITSHLEQ